MIEKYDPVNDEMFSILDNDGNVVNSQEMPELSDDHLLKAYKLMLFSRVADEMAVLYQRQGRMFTYPLNKGQEAIAAATGLSMRDDDWLVPAFRELGCYIAKGVTMSELYMYFMGYENGSLFKNAKNILPISVPIASQLLHATGIGYTLKLKKDDKVVVTFVGDGGTSEGDFHEALNFASVWKVPVVFIVQNNQYAISVPFKTQSASKSIAIKSVAYGIKGIQVDGNDYFAMKKVVEEAIDYSRSGNGPILIEAVTYRQGAHTTSDDPTKYRTKDEEDVWSCKDPLKRMKNYLITKGLWNDEEEEKIHKQFMKEIDSEFIKAENIKSYPAEDAFDYLYAEMPADLEEQKRYHLNFLKWKESRGVK
ncbi:MAG: pyruvate dehydrogenase (acetyl-transferring) E1 component subunit alpha [Candidatus Delongbacteria bacterium]|nr:pyruvate dehydrogenase (acetyl-transferring) E1 component subunit alpha [Candidatus Delongbacteria bacterium]MBN2834879.1 pyruvate dehydrogenase (acetyl-transferring) E1 component subunit alpha [Candidatus Delongbacteria bacterium]